MTALADELDRTYQAVAARLPDNPAVRFNKFGDRQELELRALDKMDKPASLIALRVKVTGMLPRVDLPELILQMAAPLYGCLHPHIGAHRARPICMCASARC